MRRFNGARRRRAAAATEAQAPTRAEGQGVLEGEGQGVLGAEGGDRQESQELGFRLARRPHHGRLFPRETLNRPLRLLAVVPE